MDFSSILTTLWSKISKPLPNILIGVVFLVSAPESVSWAGYIFLVLGLCGICEWGYPRLTKWIKKKRLVRKIQALPEEEFQVLNYVRMEGWFSFSPNECPDNEQKIKFEEIFWRLEAKKLLLKLNWSNLHAAGLSFKVPDNVQSAIKDLLEKDLKRR